MGAAAAGAIEARPGELFFCTHSCTIGLSRRVWVCEILVASFIHDALILPYDRELVVVARPTDTE